WVRQLRQTVRTGGHVRGDENWAGGVRAARLDAELPVPPRRARLPRQLFHAGQGRRLAGEFLQEAVQRPGVALAFNQDVAGLVLDVAAQPQARGEAEHEGPEADPLDDALDFDRPAFHGRRPCTADKKLPTGAGMSHALLPGPGRRPAPTTSPLGLP